MVKLADFRRDVELPLGLTVAAIRKSIEYIEREATTFVDIYLEQQNIFSGLVGIFGTKALDTHSVYEKRKHSALAQTRFPDLKRRGSPEPPPPEHSLESKASKRTWAIQAHYDHPGWYIVWRYLVDPTQSIEEGKSVLIWRVDVAFLRKEDWKYEGSTASAAGGGRTHTYGLSRPANILRDKAVYARRDIIVKAGKPMPADEATP